MVRKLKKLFSKNSKDERIQELEEIIEDGMAKNEELKEMIMDLEHEKFKNKGLINSLLEENKNLKKEMELKKRSKGSSSSEKKFISKSARHEKKIKEILKEMPSISVTELAKKVGISRQAIYKTYKHLLQGA